MSALAIRPMRRADLDIAIDWAAAEGWNPGLDDADAFLAADPQGFLMGWLGDEPVACISVVAYGAAYGFLGFYICRPEFRGQGHGWALWQAGIARLGDRTIGLDGVVEQQANYARSGFATRPPQHPLRRHRRHPRDRRSAHRRAAFRAGRRALPARSSPMTAPCRPARARPSCAPG